MSMKIINFGDLNLSSSESVPQEIIESVYAIVNDVRERGNSALLDYTEKFDGIKLEGGIRVAPEELKRAYQSLAEPLMRAMVSSAGRIRRFQELQLPRKLSAEMAPGVSVGVEFDPLQSVGIYVPGGTAAYPSTVLMTVIPAKVAGVKRIVMFTPPGPSGRIPDTVMAAAHLTGADEVYGVGGAQAIAAMAYGTETINRVEKIVGPGNVYVTAAKMLASWDIAVDMPAGPSEVLIYAEGGAGVKADWIAADIIAQAEHDARARAFFVTPSVELMHRVRDEVLALLGTAPRKQILEKSIANAICVLVKDRDEGIEAINRIAPEHLAILGEGKGEVAKGTRNAGAIFLGEYTPVALGDYSAGTNHVLPTMGWSKRASPLSVRDFLRARESINCTKEGLKNIGPDAISLADAEGLLNHARSVAIRLGGS